MADFPQGGPAIWQGQGMRDGSDAKTCVPSHGLNVHARAAPEKHNVIKDKELKSQPQVTCFGLRRKHQQPSQEPALWSKNPPTEKQDDSGKADKALTGAKPAATCGAGEMLQSFGTDFLSEIFESRSKRKENSGGHAANRTEPLMTAQKEAEDLTLTPKIMASYESISVTSQTNPQLRSEDSLRPEDYRQTDGIQDRERQDGADSIVEDEEYDAFGTPQWTVDPHDIFFISRGDGSQKVCKLGRGDYGPVYLGVWKDQEVAVKLARQAPISLKNERQFQNNIAKLHSLNHPNIVPFLGACCWKGGKRSVLVSEFMDKSDLRMLLGRPDLAPKFAWREHGQTVALDIASGLGYLHSQGLVHGRLKSANVLMNKAGVAKLSDVALHKLLSHCKTGNSEKTLRPPPIQPESEIRLTEVAENCETMSGDIFAFGLILHELLTQEKPGYGPLRAIRTPFEAPAKIAYLVECCLDSDASQRPSIDRVISIIGGKK